ncbi:PREDICTED: E3 ubiquitin-protein ligase RLIM-like isoform X1 [Nicotiana attenuata]|uniref:Receptor -likey region, transmembrane domain-and ring domain-containing protein 4 n=1 Tax=Nicotiana attenuata TaxID=49451 RepID=A0A1J6JSU2_NICAT|nr:PREDICTED: E3 ubiquitin-protein ligase RLIM-like isoform X1 [Nicotiana attenuata]OIT20802.1 receptor -likey region, transmembrane domain- and ring domain-containing protein 4 [Nicotiana attenuata]
MGSSSSRLGSHPSRPNRTKCTFSSIFICGASPSRSAIEMEDDPAELLVDSAEHADKGKLQNSEKDPSSEFIPSRAERGASSASNLVNSEKCTSGDANVQVGNRRENSTKDMELVTRYRPGSTGCETASTSRDDRPFPYPLSLNKRTENDVVNNVDTTANGDVSQIFAGSSRSSSPLYHRNGESSSSEDFVVNHTNEILIFNNSDSGSVSVLSDSSLTPHLAGDDLRQDTPSSGLEFLVSEREESLRDGSILHVDMANVSPNVFSNSPAEITSREARRNSRRLFWDSFSRRSPRRRADPRSFRFPNDYSDDVASHDRLLLDFSDNFLHEGSGGNFPSNGSRTSGSNERRRHSRSEMWERLPGGLIASDHRSATCPTGIHADGPCSCETILMSRETGSRASISRIVMLAEALFEVLDEIHRQPMSVSLSVLSLPAPESVVDSFPVKSYSKSEEVDTGNNVPQCHICLAEYEDGDKIRVLPCHHEFHVSCVDKWLKEIHGVCPLCRGDVRNGFVEGSVSNSAAPSL